MKRAMSHGEGYLAGVNVINQEVLLTPTQSPVPAGALNKPMIIIIIGCLSSLTTSIHGCLLPSQYAGAEMTVCSLQYNFISSGRMLLTAFCRIEILTYRSEIRYLIVFSASLDTMQVCKYYTLPKTLIWQKS